MIPYLGEMLSIGVAISWTVCALLSEFTSRRIGPLSLNVIRMVMSLILLSILMLVITGSPLPLHADATTWGWMLLSGVVGYVIGDYCLYNAYLTIGSRYGQLFMTLSPVAAAITGALFLHEHMSWLAVLAMCITIFGISLSVLGKGDGGRKLKVKLPMHGVLLAIGAGVCQGVGLVLSKQGMNHYTLSNPTQDAAFMLVLPFAATFMRSVAGLFGFTGSMQLTHNFHLLRAAVQQPKNLLLALGVTLFGPFLGVGFSLMAVLHTSAGVASTLMATTPILIILPTYWIYKQPITVKEVMGAAITIVGAALFFV